MLDDDVAVAASLLHFEVLLELESSLAVAAAESGGSAAAVGGYPELDGHLGPEAWLEVGAVAAVFGPLERVGGVSVVERASDDLPTVFEPIVSPTNSSSRRFIPAFICLFMDTSRLPGFMPGASCSSTGGRSTVGCLLLLLACF